MAVRTLGTNGTTTLTAIRFDPSVSDADFASIFTAIFNDQNHGQVAYNAGAAASIAVNDKRGYFSRSGQLIIPNRGVLTVRPGDFVGVDATGWPILVGNNAINSNSPATSWTHT